MFFSKQPIPKGFILNPNRSAKKISALVRFFIPENVTFFESICLLNAIPDKINILCKVSRPFKSFSGFCSAYPSFCAFFKDVLNSFFSSSILLKIKLEVPFKIPVILFIFIPLKLLFNVDIIGIPPATDASKPIFTLFSSAIFAILYPS